MKLSLLTLLAFLLINVSPLFAADTSAAASKPKKIPFHGKIQAVDLSAQTISVGEKTTRVFHVTPTTKITDGSGAASTLSAATVGEDSGGSYDKASMTLYSLRIGAKTGSKTAATESTPAPAATPSPAATTPAPAPAATEPAPAPAATTPAATTSTKVKKQTFSGKVVSVDAASSTLVVHGKADQTFTVTSMTKITGVDGLASVTAGSKVSGSYSKSADGATLTVYTLKVTPAK